MRSYLSERRLLRPTALALRKLNAILGMGVVTQWLGTLDGLMSNKGSKPAADYPFPPTSLYPSLVIYLFEGL